MMESDASYFTMHNYAQPARRGGQWVAALDGSRRTAACLGCTAFERKAGRPSVAHAVDYIRPALSRTTAVRTCTQIGRAAWYVGEHSSK